MLHVVERAPRPYDSRVGQAFWRCLCDCGGERAVCGADLRRGHATSCGCRYPAKINIGERYGRLVVLGPAGTNGKLRLWECKCDCGQKCVKAGTLLARSRLKSCGCGKRKGLGEAARNYMFYHYKSMARIRNLPFLLSREETLRLLGGSCYYCGVPPNQEARPQRYTHGAFIHNGIDRVDNNMGYVPGNVVSCCKICNRAKRSASYEEFMLWLDRLAHNWRLATEGLLGDRYSWWLDGADACSTAHSDSGGWWSDT